MAVTERISVHCVVLKNCLLFKNMRFSQLFQCKMHCLFLMMLDWNLWLRFCDKTGPIGIKDLKQFMSSYITLFIKFIQWYKYSITKFPFFNKSLHSLIQLVWLNIEFLSVYPMFYSDMFPNIPIHSFSIFTIFTLIITPFTC